MTMNTMIFEEEDYGQSSKTNFRSYVDCMFLEVEVDLVKSKNGCPSYNICAFMHKTSLTM